ncbi:MAG: TIGR00289 family protein [Candidatus Aenigmarchaeota archaeon]|nr:TIGR00289 family protein [Candidatus Aenigmarchaeota archaeon]
MKLGSLISGGKDSLFAVYLAEKEHSIECLGTMVSENKDSYMFHVPNINLTKLVAEAMQLPIIIEKTKGEKEEELADLERLLRKMKERYGIEGITTGAVASQYQKSRVDNLCRELRLQSIAPLWQLDQKQVVQEMIESGFEIIIVAVAAEGLDESWLGRRLDKKALEDLEKLNKKYGVSFVGEGGEFDTLVIKCPMFRKKIAMKEAEKIWDANTRSGMLLIKEAGLEQ